MKLPFPYPVSSITQRFGENGSVFYKEHGLLGHPGIDFKTLFDDLILFCADAPVYKIINKDNPDLTKYRAVFQLKDDGEFTYEIQYAHCNKITCTHGNVLTGDTVGTQGNTGYVAVGGKEVVGDAKKRGEGFHLHYQIRECKKTKIYNQANYYLSSEGNESVAYKDAEGNYYSIPNYTNGYNGCVDPFLFWDGRVITELKKEVSRLQALVESLKKQIAQFLNR